MFLTTQPPPWGFGLWTRKFCPDHLCLSRIPAQGKYPTSVRRANVCPSRNRVALRPSGNLPSRTGEIDRLASRCPKASSIGCYPIVECPSAAPVLMLGATHLRGFSGAANTSNCVHYGSLAAALPGIGSASRPPAAPYKRRKFDHGAARFSRAPEVAILRRPERPAPIQLRPSHP